MWTCARGGDGAHHLQMRRCWVRLIGSQLRRGHISWPLRYRFAPEHSHISSLIAQFVIHRCRCRSKAFLYAFWSGLAEPLGALIAWGVMWASASPDGSSSSKQISPVMFGCVFGIVSGGQLVHGTEFESLPRLRHAVATCPRRSPLPSAPHPLHSHFSFACTTPVVAQARWCTSR